MIIFLTREKALWSYSMMSLLYGTESTIQIFFSHLSAAPIGLILFFGIGTLFPSPLLHTEQVVSILWGKESAVPFPLQLQGL